MTKSARSATPQFRGLSPTSERASTAMRANRSKNTRPELRLRRELWRRGLRYRLHRDDLPGKPDLVFLSRKLAVFCDGDFWHGRGWSRRKEKLKRGSNSAYWVAKIESNRQRDRDQTEALELAGWTVLRFWESEIKGDVEGIADRVEQLLTQACPG